MCFFYYQRCYNEQCKLCCLFCFFPSLTLFRSSFLHFEKVVNFVSVLYWYVVNRPRSVCWHKMETKTKEEKKKNTDPAQTKKKTKTNDNSSCWAAHN